jgi:hypothetical protein
MRRVILALCAATALAGSVVSAAIGAPPASMTGEHFAGTGGTGGPASVTCTTSGDFSFSVSGAATGPYPGTFTETGSGHVTVGVPASTAGTVTSFSATFTVYSPVGAVLVTGTKTLDTSAPTGFPLNYACQQDLATGAVGIPTNYEATIYTGSGNYRDEGTSRIPLLLADPAGATLTENFVSTLSQPTPVAPTNKDQCKNGGWQNYPQFKNQGDCVSFVATGGSNPPSS